MAEEVLLIFLRGMAGKAGGRRVGPHDAIGFVTAAEALEPPPLLMRSEDPALQNADLTSVCQSVVDELTVTYPAAKIVFNDSTTINGRFDPSRMAQVFSNLIGNAVQHGDSQHPVNLTLNAVGTSAQFYVQNHGAPIPPHCPLSSIRKVGILGTLTVNPERLRVWD